MSNPNQQRTATYEELSATESWETFWSEDRPAEYDYYAYDRPRVLGDVALRSSVAV